MIDWSCPGLTTIEMFLNQSFASSKELCNVFNNSSIIFTTDNIALLSEILRKLVLFIERKKYL